MPTKSMVAVVACTYQLAQDAVTWAILTLGLQSETTMTDKVIVTRRRRGITVRVREYLVIEIEPLGADRSVITVRSKRVGGLPRRARTDAAS